MSDPAVSDYELSLIKGMIRMEIGAGIIQSYFTRPDRLVNPARIQEIKLGTNRRALELEAATDEEVNEFIARYATEYPILEGHALPDQDKNAIQFGLRNDGKLTLSPADESTLASDPRVREIYGELRLRTEDFYGLGDNSLGPIRRDIERFLEAIPEDPSSASAITIFMRGNGLGSKVASYKLSRENPDLQPAVHLDAALLPIFEELLACFNLLVTFTPEMAYLAERAKGPEQFKEQGEALESIKPAIDDASTVADDEATHAVQDQLMDGLIAADNTYGRNQRELAYLSIKNFSISVFTPILDAAKYIFRDDIPSITKAMRNTLATKATADFYIYLKDKTPAIVDYVQKNAEALIAYTHGVITDHTIQSFFVEVIGIIRGFL